MTVGNCFEDKQPEESLGAYIARARQARGYSVEELAEITKITKNNLTSIENGEWKSFQVEAYLRGYLNSLCVKLNLDKTKVMSWYAAESGSYTSAKMADASTKISPMEEENAKHHSSAAIIVIILLGLAFLVAVNFMDKLSGNAEESPVPQKETPAVEEVTQDSTEMPEGAESVAADSVTQDTVKAAAPASDSVVSQAQVDEALKKSDLPASATIFISSTSKKEEEVVTSTKMELVGSGVMPSWVGLKRHEDSNSFLKESNIAAAGAKMVYTTEDTLYVVIGEPRAVSKMILNGVETVIPKSKNSRVARFRVYGGQVLK